MIETLLISKSRNRTCDPDTNSITLLLKKSPVNDIRLTNLFTSEHFRESKLD